VRSLGKRRPLPAVAHDARPNDREGARPMYGCLSFTNVVSHSRTSTCLHDQTLMRDDARSSATLAPTSAGWPTGRSCPTQRHAAPPSRAGPISPPPASIHGEPGSLCSRRSPHGLAHGGSVATTARVENAPRVRCLATRVQRERRGDNVRRTGSPCSRKRRRRGEASPVPKRTQRERHEQDQQP